MLITYFDTHALRHYQCIPSYTFSAVLITGGRETSLTKNEITATSDNSLGHTSPHTVDVDTMNAICMQCSYEAKALPAIQLLFWMYQLITVAARWPWTEPLGVPGDIQFESWL